MQVSNSNYENYYVKQASNTLNKHIDDSMNRFFGNENMDYLQKTIIVQIRQQLKVTISRQSDQELFVVMLYVYTSHSQYCTNIRMMNQLVLQEIIPMIASNVIQYNQYLKDIGTQPMPLNHSKNTSIKGEKTLEFTGF